MELNLSSKVQKETILDRDFMPRHNIQVHLILTPIFCKRYFIVLIVIDTIKKHNFFFFNKKKSIFPFCKLYRMGQASP